MTTSGFAPRSVAPVFPIRMLALDIDGTLVGHDLVLRERTRAAVNAAVRHGVHVSIVTGRMVGSALQFARALGLEDPIVGAQGGVIRAMPEPGSSRPGRLLLHRPLDAATARAAIGWTREHGLDPHLNHLETFVIRSDDPRVDDYSAFLGGAAHIVSDLLEYVRRPVTKVIAAGPEPLPLSLLPVARTLFAGRAEATVSHPHFLEIVAPGVNKGAAVRWLARRHGIPLGQVMAVGDQWNDFEMLQAVGHGAAMAGAPERVRAAARYVAPPVEAEGVAEMVESLVLAAERSAVRHATALESAASAARAGAGEAAREVAIAVPGGRVAPGAG
jgi:Cof subfamily protein (haloacid dehalogenase superfamily)